MKLDNQISNLCCIDTDCIISKSDLRDYSRVKRNVEVRESILGEYSYISSNSIVNYTEIQKFTSIGPGCYIGLWEHDREVSTHSFYLYETSGFFVKGYKNYKRDKIKTFIGNDVWIGANVTIKKGVTIGDGAIIGSSSVITKDVEPYSIVVGNPGRLLKFRFSKEDVGLFMTVKWWDFSRDKLKKMIELDLFSDFAKFKNYIIENYEDL